MPNIDVAVASSIQVPKDVSKDGQKQSMFLIYYREGQNPHAVFKLFFDHGNLNDIIERCKDFCKNTNKRFVRCEPAILDFGMEQKRLMGSDN